MKKLILASLFLGFFLVSCGGNQSSQDAAQTPAESENQEMVDETTKADSVSTEMENAKKEIDESSENLDELLNDL